MEIQKQAKEEKRKLEGEECEFLSLKKLIKMEFLLNSIKVSLHENLWFFCQKLILRNFNFSVFKIFRP